MTAAPPPVLRIQALHKRFGSHHVLRGIDLDVLPGDRIAIIGASGSGKSTLLRCLNFMEMPSAGQVILKGRAVGSPAAGSDIRRYGESELSEVRKQVGMVFQQFNLFPHMTVLQNVMEGLVTVKRLPAAQARERAMAQIAKVGLAEKAAAYPGHLSGGQQQRVAIARALAMEPEVLLFDEPTSSLDPELVGEVLGTIRALADEGRTMLLVTHELGFAYHFANKVVFLADGLLHESGTPDEVLKHPKQERTQRFIERFTAFHF
ncbi:amino acid ABC transporter ATP-binding protein [Variovorax paradoxus]|jgi:polar amino acid transport system ATP-binding protein|uniref:amino acid ABC transporter ATP-binding protein n=1 Tax=Variovorax paradoxus TaxID=34073 RepID=UPI0029C5FD2C|nr:amino acid ABC transporter ATP-binding protein [Variovorax paradoxus]WPH20503.1 amino acid ABC transporter ATP-binding protein [Variovorax paradoxus]